MSDACCLRAIAGARCLCGLTDDERRTLSELAEKTGRTLGEVADAVWRLEAALVEAWGLTEGEAREAAPPLAETAYALALAYKEPAEQAARKLADAILAAAHGSGNDPAAENDDARGEADADDDGGAGGGGRAGPRSLDRHSSPDASASNDRAEVVSDTRTADEAERATSRVERVTPSTGPSETPPARGFRAIADKKQS